MRSNTPILLVEDDDVDILSTQRAFSELSISNPLIITKNGEDALEYLMRSDNVRPGLILLDLNMPRVSGIEFLRQYKSVDRLKWIPAVVLTTSANHRDIQDAYMHQTAGYMVKPLNFDEFKDVIKDIYEYWRRCELPDHH
ncbi:MAG: response regulator [Flavobacteriales bacterium]|nr:response regulator [Flavobacteriales bacterium]